MLLRTLAASLLGNALTGRGGKIRAGKETIKTGENFWRCLILYVILKYKNIIKTNLNLMVFIQNIIYLK